MIISTQKVICYIKLWKERFYLPQRLPVRIHFLIIIISLNDFNFAIIKTKVMVRFVINRMHTLNRNVLIILVDDPHIFHDFMNTLLVYVYVLRVDDL